MLTVRGGARLGYANVTIPLAVLQASAEGLSVRAGALGAVSFRPDEVVSIEPFVWVPVLAWGLRVVHTRDDAPAVVRFWCIGSPRSLRDRVLAAGFVPSAPATSAVAPEGLPFRPWVLPLAAAVWTLVMAVDKLRAAPGSRLPGVATRALWATYALAALGLLVSARVQSALLRPGRSPTPVAPVLRLVAGVLALMTVLSTLEARR